MLKVKALKKKQALIIEYDPYVPVNIKFREIESSIEPITCVRAGVNKDIEKSILEFGVGQNTGCFYYITLVLARGTYSDGKPPFEIECKTLIEGIPVLQVGELEGNLFTDKTTELNIYIDKGNVYILFASHETQVITKNGMVSFCLDKDNNITGIILNDLRKQDLYQFRELIS